MEIYQRNSKKVLGIKIYRAISPISKKEQILRSLSFFNEKRLCIIFLFRNDSLLLLNKTKHI
jgi:hypothetical protein